MSDVTGNNTGDSGIDAGTALDALLADLKGPTDVWDRPGGTWGSADHADEATLTSAETEQRRDANSAYRLGTKALRRSDLSLALRWFNHARTYQHPGAAFRSAVVFLRHDRVLVAQTGSGKTRHFLAAVRMLVDAARWGHGDAQRLMVHIDMASRPTTEEAAPTAGIVSGDQRREDAAAEREYEPQDGEFFQEVREAVGAVRRLPQVGQQKLPSPGTASSSGSGYSWSAHSLRAPALTQAARQTQDSYRSAAPIDSVHRALRVLEAISRHSGGVSSMQITRETNLPRQVLARVLNTLCRVGLIAQVADSAYIAGPALRLLGSADGGGRAQLHRILTLLRHNVGAAVYVSRYRDGEVDITQYADGPRTPKVNEWVDFRSAAHASAVGKCLLAQLDYDDRMDHLARHKTARLTSRTITNQSALFTALDNRPPAQPVLDLQEYAVGTVCAAVPISTASSAGCLALSLPVERAHHLQQAAATLNSQAAVVLLSLLVNGEQSASRTTINAPSVPAQDTNPDSSNALEPHSMNNAGLPDPSHLSGHALTAQESRYGIHNVVRQGDSLVPPSPGVGDIHVVNRGSEAANHPAGLPPTSQIETFCLA